MLDTLLVRTCLEKSQEQPSSTPPRPRPSPATPSPPLSPDVEDNCMRKYSHYCGLARTTFDAILRRFPVCGDMK